MNLNLQKRLLNIRLVKNIGELNNLMTLPKRDFKAERAARALQELSDAASRNGTSDMTLEEINSEIAAVRNG